MKKNDHVYLLGWLKHLANNCAIRFKSPVYLVGSFVDDPENAIDIDIILVLTNDRFKRLFKAAWPCWNERRWKFRKKQKEYFEIHVPDWDFDFKVQTLSQFRKHKGKRIKLDNVMRCPE